MPSIADLRALTDQNPSLFYAVEVAVPHSPPTMSIVGCFTLVPLKMGAVRRLDEGEAIASAIKPDLITKKGGTPRGLYVGLAIGSNWAAKGFTLREVKREVNRLCRKYGIPKVFGRPITPDGLRVLRRNGFKDVLTKSRPEMNCVCCRTWTGTN